MRWFNDWQDCAKQVQRAVLLALKLSRKFQSGTFVEDRRRLKGRSYRENPLSSSSSNSRTAEAWGVRGFEEETELLATTGAQERIYRDLLLADEPARGMVSGCRSECASFDPFSPLVFFTKSFIHKIE